MEVTVQLDEKLLQKASAVTGVENQRDLFELALQTLIDRRPKKDLIDLAGKVRLREDYDYKSLRQTRFPDSANSLDS